ncbi:MAG: hypothetical protein ACI4F5_04115 [Acutalibacteraceae bacterium]
MKKIICKVEYDTEKATLVKKVTSGNFGESDGYEEALYQTDKGAYFLYVNGGADSKYPKEDIKRMSKDKAKLFIEAE